MIRRWKKWGAGTRIALVLSLLVGAWTAWWWIDSAVTCDQQDEYSYHGFCLMELQRRAESGDNPAQWAYGNYLAGIPPFDQAYDWHLKAMHGARIGLELRRSMDAYCDKVPGFDARTVESVMQRVVRTSPDAHLRLFQLYLSPPPCSAFSLDQASAQIPLLTQCAHLTLAEYFRAVERERYTLSAATRAAIRGNLDRCENELAHPPPEAPTVREFMPLQPNDIEALRRSLDKTAP